MNLIIKVYNILKNTVIGIIDTFRQSKTARALLLIVIIKLSIFYGFFKSYWFPNHLKPEWESEQHRIEDVTNSLIYKHKNTEND